MHPTVKAIGSFLGKGVFVVLRRNGNFGAAGREIAEQNWKEGYDSLKVTARTPDPKAAVHKAPAYLSEFADLQDCFNAVSRLRLLSLPAKMCVFARGVFDMLKKRLSTWEFWLGFGFGAVTRVVAKIVILTAFSSVVLPRSASFVACAVAGLLAGVVTHAVRVAYFNRKRPTGTPEAPFYGMGLLESSMIGWLGGMLGGITTNANFLTAGLSTFAIGAFAGGVIGMLRAFVRADWRAKQGGAIWEGLAFQGAVFGAFGGILGVVSANLFGPSVSVAASAPVAHAGEVVYTNLEPRIDPYCGDECTPRPLPPPPEPVPVPVVTPQEEVIHATAPKQVTHVHHHHHHYHTRQAKHHLPLHKKNECLPEKPRVRPVVRRPHVARHAELVEYKAPVEKIVPTPMIRQTLPPQPVDPCVWGECAPRCDNANMLYIKGPCGDPDTPCAERISFNEDGEATKAVLEPAPFRANKPYYEITRGGASSGGYASKAVDLNYEPGRYASNDSGEARVSLVVPITNNGTLALGGIPSSMA